MEFVALDAYCLVEIYNFLQQRSETVGVNWRQLLEKSSPDLNAKPPSGKYIFSFHCGNRFIRDLLFFLSEMNVGRGKGRFPTVLVSPQSQGEGNRMNNHAN